MCHDLSNVGTLRPNVCVSLVKRKRSAGRDAGVVISIEAARGYLRVFRPAGGARRIVTRQGQDRVCGLG